MVHVICWPRLNLGSHDLDYIIPHPCLTLGSLPKGQGVCVFVGISVKTLGPLIEEVTSSRPRAYTQASGGLKLKTNLLTREFILFNAPQ